MEECGGVAKSAKSDYAKIGWKEKKKRKRKESFSLYSAGHFENQAFF
jgi:hypothetical protein